MSLEQKEQDYIIGLRRYFHQHPELPMKEYETANYVEQELHKFGIPTHRVGGTGICGILSHVTDERTAKTIGLRADMDALPVQESTGVSYASENAGVMHACGHDAHTAALLGAAKRLAADCENLNGTVKFFFQQAEENCQGAKLFVASEEVKNVDRVLGVHMCSYLPLGKMSLRGGECSASCDRFVIEVHGKSAHAAMPHQSVDAVYIASQIAVNLQAIIARETNPIETGVVSVGMIHGGTGYNIVAETARLEGTTRAFHKDIRAFLNRRIKEIAEGIGASYGATIEVEIQNFTCPLINDNEVAAEVAEVAVDLFGEDVAEYHYSKTMMGDDFAEYLNDAKGMYVWIGSSDGPGSDTSYPHHHEKFNINEQAVIMASELYEAYVRKLLEHR